MISFIKEMEGFSFKGVKGKILRVLYLFSGISSFTLDKFEKKCIHFSFCVKFRKKINMIECIRRTADKV